VTPLRLAVFQPTSLCNLDCRYCYVAARRDAARMDDATLEAAVREVLHSRLLDTSVRLLWHAGEPLAAGREYYEHAFELVDAHRPSAQEVELSIQTNATLLDDRWIALFVERKVSVGVSIDGPAWLHDRHRPTVSGRATHAQAMRGVRLLLDAGLPVGALCVLSRDSLSSPDELYEFFVESGIRSVGFNVEETEGIHLRSSLATRPPPRLYARFMRRMWDRWRTDPELLTIREFDRALRVIRERRDNPLWHPVPDDTVGFRNVTIDKHGNVTTFSPELAGHCILGNIRTQTLDAMAESQKYSAFAAEVAAGVHACAATCGYFELCGAGFVSNKYFEHGTVRATETVTCRLHRQQLFDVVLERLAGETAAREGALTGAPSR
jgi:uncharacterized protein